MSDGNAMMVMVAMVTMVRFRKCSSRY